MIGGMRRWKAFTATTINSEYHLIKKIGFVARPINGKNGLHYFGTQRVRNSEGNTASCQYPKAFHFVVLDKKPSQ